MQCYIHLSYLSGIDLSEAAVGETVVQHLLPGVCCGDAFITLALAQHRRAAYKRVRKHKCDEHPTDDDTVGFGNAPFDKAVQPWKYLFHPYQRQCAPEQAIQQIDASVQVERIPGIVPTHGAQHGFLQPAAEILEGASDDGTADEDPAVAFSDERMQADGEQHRADAVDQIERPPHEAGAL